jgi:hypothetical protein
MSFFMPLVLLMLLVTLLFWDGKYYYFVNKGTDEIYDLFFSPKNKQL